ncbi:MAG: disulfide bond formation protein B [Chromatiales bacterium]|nr:MAG: disulfide bond formation protein B [Chromatiales bacterium]
MKLLLNPRIANLLGALVCAGMMGFALFAQYGLKLEPCPLCILQRVAVIAMGIVFAVAALHGPGRAGGFVYGALVAVAAGAGAGVAGRQVWLQNLPKDQVPACGPGLDFMLDTFGLGEALQMVLSGSGECADVAWRFLGLSMPSWVLLWCVVLGLFALWANFRRRDEAAA